MSQSSGSPIVGLVRSIFCLSILLLGVSGCADVLTYSRDAQHQGEILYKQGDYADAAGAFRNSVRQNPENYQGYYWMGASYEQLKQYEEAIAAYRSARKTISLSLAGKYDDEFHDKILIGLASAIAKCDKRDIETNAAQTDAESRGTADSWFVLAKIYEFRGDADSAIDAYNRATLLEPNNFLVQKNYGLFLERVGQADRAETPLRRAYSLNNTDEQVVAALRRIGVVPGPSLEDQSALAKPLLPKGPIPDVPIPGSGSSQNTAAVPRD